MPFRVPLDRPIAELAAGQKQKLEILKQIYLKSRFLILDEPTSVLTPQEAEEVLGLLKTMADNGEITVFMITHKFREVEAFAEDVSVLRRGKLAGAGKAAELSRDDMAAMMIGSRTVAQVATREGAAAERPVLEIHALSAKNQTGTKSVAVDELIVHAHEIVGIAGVSGNGQKELAEVLAGQRFADSGAVRVGGTAYGATRAETREHQVRFIPEEPLRNACAPRMAVAENLAFRTFDTNRGDRNGGDANGGSVNGGEKPSFWLKLKSMRSAARVLVENFQVKTASIESPIATLSGGNVQRAVLARELTGDVDLLVVANPCFGLDFSAVAEIRSRIVAARNGGAAVLLISEDLDEILELADRILVMSEGKIVYETPGDKADVGVIGQHMAGHH